jgi:DNA processing protein
MGATCSAQGADEAALGLAMLSQSGCHSLLRFLEREGPEAVWRASRRRLLQWGLVLSAVDRFEEKRRCFAAEEIRALLARTCVHFLPYGSPYYPLELSQLRYPPAGLFARATEEALSRFRTLPRVTIVGTRRATPYGLRATEAFASAFAAAGVVVVSGMALGIDGRAHQAALDAGALTVAVVGCGTDVVYPQRHRGLYELISGKGVVLSELPPGTAPARWTFPHRNRLLAALGDAVLVTEGSRTSGALQTAGWALELGRPVFAVPGPISMDNHEGCNQLLYDGAGPALDPWVAVEDFLLQTRIERGERRVRKRLEQGDDRRGGSAGRGNSPAGSAAGPVGCLDSSTAYRSKAAAVSIMEALEHGGCSVDSLVGHTGLATRQLTAALAEMELMGLVRRGGPGLYIRAP